MPKGLVFWIVFLICVLFSGWTTLPNWKQNGGSLVVYILIFLLGWAVFGFIVQ